MNDSDTLVLEDELQRIKLAGDCIDVHQVVTGVVCALLGEKLYLKGNSWKENKIML